MILMDKLLGILSRILYPNERAVEPGKFEAFLSPPVEASAIPEHFRPRHR